MKTVKFTPELTELIKKGQKNVTFRLFDDKNLSVGDDVILATRDGDEVTNFAKAKLVEVKVKKLRQLNDEDYEGHERVDNPVEYYRKFYGDKVNENTEVKIIKFKLDNYGCVWVGIGIDISSGDPTAKKIVDLHTKFKGEYNFDHQLKLPLHINLYDLDVPKENLTKIDKSIRKIADATKPFTIPLLKIDHFEHGSIFVKCGLTKQLIELEEEIVKLVYKTKGHCKTKDYFQPWRKYSNEETKNMNIYGNPYVLNTFNPHITLGFLKANKDTLRKVCKDLNKDFEPTSLVANQIGMAIQARGKAEERITYKFVI